MADIMVRDESSSALSVIMQALPGVKPNVAVRIAARFQKAGITQPTDIKKALEIQRYYGTTPASIAKWVESGLTLQKVELCLHIRATYGIEKATVPLIAFFVEGAAFQIEENAEALFEAFEEVSAEFGGEFPMHRLKRKIEEIYGGDVLHAYHEAIEDPRGFARKIANNHRSGIDGHIMVGVGEAYGGDGYGE